MSSTPDAPHDPTGSADHADPADTHGPGDTQGPADSGPRVTREEARDLGRIRRSTSDRKIAGVAGGIARHFDIDPLLVRVGFVLLTFFGGGGVLAYIAGWLLIPEEGSDDATIRVDDRSRTVVLAIVGGVAALSLIGDSFGGWGFPWPLAVVGLIAAGVLAVAGGTRRHPGPLPSSGWVQPRSHPGPGTPPPGTPSYVGYQPSPPPPPADCRRRGPLLFWFTMALSAVLVAVVATLDAAGMSVPDSAYPATVLATCGVMLLVGAFYGRAGGLIAVGLVAALATAFTAAAVQIDGGAIEKTPTSVASLEDGYDLGAGSIRIDLTEIEDPAALDGRTLDLEVMFGEIKVVVPDDGLDILAKGDVTLGEVKLFGDSSTGSEESQYDGASGETPQLIIDAEVVIGQIQIETESAVEAGSIR